MKTIPNRPFARRLPIIGIIVLLAAQLSTASAGTAKTLAAAETGRIAIASKDAIAASLVYAGLMDTEVIALNDSELNQIRGGLRGFHLGFSFSGIFDKLGNLSGQIFPGSDSVPQEIVADALSQTTVDAAETTVAGNDTTTPPSSTTPPSITTPPSSDTVLPTPDSSITEVGRAEVDGANISAYVGNFDGASGIFQISQSPGSYNVITNNMTINITVYNLDSETQASGILPSYINFQ